MLHCLKPPFFGSNVLFDSNVTGVIILYMRVSPNSWPVYNSFGFLWKINCLGGIWRLFLNHSHHVSTQTRNPKHLLVRSPSDTVNMKKVCITLACIETRVNNRIKLINYPSTSTAEGCFFPSAVLVLHRDTTSQNAQVVWVPTHSLLAFVPWWWGESWDQRLIQRRVMATHGRTIFFQGLC